MCGGWECILVEEETVPGPLPFCRDVVNSE